jgi:hypothetical protein
VVAAGGVALSVAVGKGRAHVTHGPGENPTIETRLEALEKNVISIHERISQTQKEMDEELGKTADALKREEQSRQAEDRAIREKLEATGTGGVHISAIGASWLFVGGNPQHCRHRARSVTQMTPKITPSDDQRKVGGSMMFGAIVPLSHISYDAKPNQPMQPTAGGRTTSPYFMRSHLLQATRALASGG